ncbi:MAG TPA: hypothetical protein VF048_06195 [Gemmatimonadaceae bacterium]
MRQIAILLFLTLVPACSPDPARAAWRRGEAITQIVAERARAVDPGASISLRDLAPFRWERLYVVDGTGPGGAGALGDSLGSGWAAVAAARPAALAGDPLLVFLAGGQVIAAAALPAAAAGLAPALVGHGYAPDEAAFRVERAAATADEPNPTPRLVP